MKKLLLLIILVYSMIMKAQVKEKAPFIIASLSTTFGINQNYNLTEDDDGLFIIQKSILLRAEFGCQFNKRWASSINFGYDHHFTYSINAIPYYTSLKYNFNIKTSSVYFVEASYGKMWRPSSKFSDGNYYKVGVGLISFSNARWNGVIKLDFHRKKILGFKNENLDSLFLGICFPFL